MNHSPGPWSIHEDDCLLDANGVHIICMGHDYDEGGVWTATLPRQKDQRAKEIAVIEANQKLIAMAPQMLADILKLRAELLLVANAGLRSAIEVRIETDHYEEFRR